MPVVSSKSRQALAADAQSRGFTYRRELAGLGLPGILFRAGGKTVASDVVDARASATPFIAGSLIGTYAEDTSLPRQIPSSFVAIPLKREVPNILLFGKGIGMLRLAGVAMGGRQRLSLEGDFDRSFTLYCPQGYERDALTIFTPDLMQLLIDTTSGCDVELVDDWMFVYSAPGRYTKPGILDRVVAVTALVHDKVHRQTSRYADERSAKAGATVSPAEHAARVGRVAEQGRRLRTRPGAVQTIITVASTAVLAVAFVRVFFPQFVPWIP